MFVFLWQHLPQFYYFESVSLTFLNVFFLHSMYLSRYAGTFDPRFQELNDYEEAEWKLLLILTAEILIYLSLSFVCLLFVARRFISVLGELAINISRQPEYES